MDLNKMIRSIEDYPEKGVTFRDITTLLKDGDAFKQCIEELIALAEKKEIDKIVGIEARGFLIGAPMAYAMGKGFVPVRKPGKLPAETVATHYDLEYGSDSVEMHIDGIEKGERVLIVDDLLATGGTGKAAVQLCKEVGADVAGCLFLIELDGLNGRDDIGVDVDSLLHFPA